LGGDGKMSKFADTCALQLDDDNEH